MITTLDILDIIYARLAASDMIIGTTNSISGGLYKLVRPMDASKEDIVINCLPVTNDLLQLATVNVNIYVPDLHASVGGIQQHLPDLARLDELAAMAITSLKDVNTPGYYFYVASQVVYNEEAIHQHFVNIRIEFRNINP